MAKFLTANIDKRQREKNGEKTLALMRYLGIFFFFFFFLVFLEPHLRHMEVPGLGVKLELQLPACIIATAMQDLATSVTYTAAHGNAVSLTQ